MESFSSIFSTKILNYFVIMLKKIAIETHPFYPDLRKVGGWARFMVKFIKLSKVIDICFRLFKRDHRFYLSGSVTSEWQKENSDFKLQLHRFKDEVDLARFLITSGELYFINNNFL
jgi:hypothetical protein